MLDCAVYTFEVFDYLNTNVLLLHPSKCFERPWNIDPGFQYIKASMRKGWLTSNIVRGDYLNLMNVSEDGKSGYLVSTCFFVCCSSNPKATRFCGSGKYPS